MKHRPLNRTWDIQQFHRVKTLFRISGTDQSEPGRVKQTTGSGDLRERAHQTLKAAPGINRHSTLFMGLK
ncbi:MAG: hypothetical protein MI799_16430 [Desulfobacterales bacterium]|nr:hypothetical protein [Desulfobacterales bacterium]